MRRIIFIWIALISTGALAQNYIAPEPNERQEKEAKELTIRMNKELSLTGDQILAAEQINGEFIARRDLIIGRRDLSITDRNKLLYAMYLEQGNELSDVLVRYQITKFKKIRGKLQPLVVLKDE
jgi:hypothetical protein